MTSPRSMVVVSHFGLRACVGLQLPGRHPRLSRRFRGLNEKEVLDIDVSTQLANRSMTRYVERVAPGFTGRRWRVTCPP